MSDQETRSETGKKPTGNRKKRPAHHRGPRKDAKAAAAASAPAAQKRAPAGKAEKTEKAEKPAPAKKDLTKKRGQQPRKGAGQPSAGAQGARQTPAKKRTTRKGPPKIHDDYDDIRSYGGRYLELPDLDDGELSLTGTGQIKYHRAPSPSPAEEKPRQPEVDEGQAPVAGRNAVRELLRSGRSVDKLFVKAGQREGSLVAIVGEARRKKIPVSEVAAEKLDQLARGANHQGVVAVAAEKEYTDITGILEIAASRGELPLVVIADSVEDPHNLGALIRCAECAGAHGVIIPKRRSAGLTPVVAKASAGALAHMAVARVSSIQTAVDELKRQGLWIFVSEADGAPYYETDFRVPAAIVFGSEGNGVSRTVRQMCDFTVSIPMYGKVNSLNVSTAASVILCHAARMQHTR